MMERSSSSRIYRSISENPGTFGVKFFTSLFRGLDLDHRYERYPTKDIVEAIRAMRAEDVRGAAVAMPYKSTCIPLLDDIDPIARRIGAVNTIVNDDGRLTGYNTDFVAVKTLISERGWDPSRGFVLHGSGGMARAVLMALREYGFESGTIVARNEEKGKTLAREFGFSWMKSFDGEIADSDRNGPAYLLNCTPIGMAGTPGEKGLSFPEAWIASAMGILESVARPAETLLVKRAWELGRPVIQGTEIIVLQAVEQFFLYTGVRPNSEVILKAKTASLG